MHRTLLVALALTLAAGCTKPAPPPAASEATPTAQDPHASLDNLPVEVVSTMVAERKCTPVDANGAETRQKYGVLPGAVLLTDTKSPQELPADKSTKLVFYCGGPACTSAPKAAQAAMQAGYTDVHVMRDGIKGWVSAGKPIDKPKS